MTLLSDQAFSLLLLFTSPFPWSTGEGMFSYGGDVTRPQSMSLYRSCCQVSGLFMSPELSVFMLQHGILQHRLKTRQFNVSQ